MPFSNREELAWAAGLFTGEGYTSLNGNGSPTRRLRLGINMTTLEDLQHFQATLGGLGRITGPKDVTKYSSPNAKPIYSFNISNFEEIQATLAALWFKLGSSKRIQATRVLCAFNADPHRRRGKRGTRSHAHV